MKRWRTPTCSNSHILVLFRSCLRPLLARGNIGVCGSLRSYKQFSLLQSDNVTLCNSPAVLLRKFLVKVVALQLSSMIIDAYRPP